LKGELMKRAKVTTLAIFAVLVVALLGVEKLAVGQDADPVLVGAGDIASCASSGDEATANLLDGIPGTVYTLGDNAYESGTSAEFANCYNPSWGRHMARTRPSVGNHEYLTAGASGYYNYFGAAAGDPSKGYYSYDLGAWHIIALNSMCENVGGCGASSTMVTWLKGDLAANPSSCTLAYWHHPVFSSGSTHGNNPKMIPSWDALYAGGADVVLSGHDHDYERFAPQTSSGVADPTRGIREFVVGTGGRSHRAFGTIRANSEVRNSDTYGVLKLTLHTSSYEWQFVPEAGKTFSDSGSGSCH
jgi:acid phosphatase type 7